MSNIKQELDGASASLAKLREAAEGAAGAIEGMASEGGGGGRAGGTTTLGAVGRGAGSGGMLRSLAKSGYAAALSAANDVKDALLEAATPGVDAFQANGSIESAAGATFLSLADQFRKSGAVGSFISEAIGASDALDVIGRTQARVSSITEDLARAGVAVPDEFRQSLIDRNLEREKRVQDERDRVAAELGNFNNIQKAGGDSLFSQMVGLLGEIRDSLKGSVGATNR